MWEWSNQILNKNKKAKPSKTSLLSAYNDLLSSPDYKLQKAVKSVPMISDSETETETLSLDEMQKLLETRLQELNLSGMHLELRPYDPQTWQEMISTFNEYERARKIFLKLLAYTCEAECFESGLNKEDIFLLKNSTAPENYNTHLKIPFDFGGNIDFSNFCLIRTNPDHDNIHRIFDMQIENDFLKVHKQIFIPTFKGKIYHG